MPTPIRLAVIAVVATLGALSAIAVATADSGHHTPGGRLAPAQQHHHVEYAHGYAFDRQP